MRARVEPFGAWIRLDQPDALVAVDRARARRLGLDGGALWDHPEPPYRRPAPLEVHLAVNARCGVGCEGCYLETTPHGATPSFDELTARLASLSAAGVFTVAFGGGEPLLRRDLPELAHHARSLGLTPVMTTSGSGMTAARAATLRSFGQVNVSHDGVAGGYEAVRGVDGAASAERAIALLSAAGVRVGVNLVLTRANLAHVEATAAHVRSLGAVEIQLLRFKPAGRAARLDYLARRLTDAQIATIPSLLRSLTQTSGLGVRVDCSMLPWLADGDVDPDALARLGVLGCEAGRHLAAATVDGRIAPCSFLGATDLDVTALPSPADDPALAAIRQHGDSPPAEPCASCPLRHSCRGGCRAVAAWYGQPDAPDPECPRVRAHHAPA